MTMMPPAMPAGPPPADLGNSLLASAPAFLTTALAPTTDGQKLLLTIRTPSSTTTVFLSRQDAETWAAQLVSTAQQMSHHGLIVAQGNGTPQTPAS